MSSSDFFGKTPSPAVAVACHRAYLVVEAWNETEGQMFRTSLRIAIAATLVGMGWMAAQAQKSQPDFEIVVDAPEGYTAIHCVRGCELAYFEGGLLNPHNAPIPTFKFQCRVTPDLRCSSRKVGGWIKR